MLKRKATTFIKKLAGYKGQKMPGCPGSQTNGENIYHRAVCGREL